MRHVLICAALAAATLVAYARVFTHHFVYFDDQVYVTENPAVKAGLTAEGFRWAFKNEGYASNWHPLTWLSHMLDCQLFGLNPGAHHAVSLALHVASTLVLYAWLYAMTRASRPSALVAALFALHPLHVESVAWVAERKDVLSGLFAMLTLFAYSRYVSDTRHKLAWYTAVLTSYALGLLAKPMLVTLPFVMLLLDYWPLRRPPARHLLIEKLPLFALALTSSIVTFIVQQRGGAVAALAKVPLNVRLANAVVAYPTYVLKLLWPIRLQYLYPLDHHIPWWRVASAAILLIAITALVIHQARRRPHLAVGWFWFVGTLVPVIGIIQVGEQSIADRYTYLPSIGFFIALTWTAAGFRLPKPALMTTAASILLACFVLTFRQTAVWADDASLFGHALAIDPNNARARNALGTALYFQGWDLERRGDVDAAVDRYRRALDVDPTQEHASVRLGLILASRGDLQSAEVAYRAAIRGNPNAAWAHANLGNLLMSRGDSAGAAAEFTETLRLKDDNYVAHIGLGILAAGSDNLPAAESHFRRAVASRPDSAEAHNNLARVLSLRGDRDAAIDEYRKALTLNPHLESARRNLELLQSKRAPATRNHP